MDNAMAQPTDYSNRALLATQTRIASDMVRAHSEDKSRLSEARQLEVVAEVIEAVKRKQAQRALVASAVSGSSAG